MKQLMAVSAVMIVVLSWFAGCGGQPSGPAPTPPAPGAKEAPQAPEQPAASPAAPETPASEAAAPAAPAGKAKSVTIYRDTYGVPHIYADTPAAAAYGLGYAQAEDRLADLYANVRTAIGASAEAFGPDLVERDYIMRLFKNVETCRDYWPQAPGEIRAVGDSFIAGVNAYVAEHPEKKPEWALDLEGWHCAAIGRAMILNWPLGTIEDDMRNKDQAPPMGSNGWVVAPSRSAEGCPILLTDPHLTWEGMSVFYEARVHGGDLQMNGFFLVGSPVVALGNNGHVAWACTTGGPDTSDVYMVKLNPENPVQYRYDNEWKTAEVTTISIPVKGQAPVDKMAAYTIHGPVVADPDLEKGIAYCGATPYYGETTLFEQMYNMTTAKNCEEFYRVLAMNQFMEQNMMFADTEGNIQYVRTGRTPIRPEEYNWSAPVPGSTSATKWQGIHPIEDMVQIKNPPQGYFQNCNISPQLMMKDSPMTPDKYRKYIYNVSWDYTNPRGRRSTALLDADNSITKEEAMAIAMDVYDLLAEPWQKALKAAVDAAGKDKMADAKFAKAVETILAWNGEFTPDSAAAPILRFWRGKCENAVDIVAIADGLPLSAADQTKMLDLLGETLAEMEARYGKPDMTWGEIQVVGRGDVFFPVGGAEFGGGKDKKNESETLFDVDTREEPKGSGKFVAYSGSMATMLMFLHKDGIEAYSCTPWGQSADPASPHFMDQGEQLYSKRVMKPTWFKKEELDQHIESTKTLTIPG